MSKSIAGKVLIYERKGLNPDILNGNSFGLKLNEQESDGGGRRAEDRGGCDGGGEEDEERGDGGAVVVARRRNFRQERRHPAAFAVDGRSTNQLNK